MDERRDRTNLIVGAVVEWTTFDLGGVVGWRGRVLDSQLSDSGEYVLLLDPKRVSEGSVNGWRNVGEHETHFHTTPAKDCHIPTLDPGEVPGEGYRAPA